MTQITHVLDEKQITFTTQWRPHLDGHWEGNNFIFEKMAKWRGSVQLTYGELTLSFFAPDDVASLKSIFSEFNEGDEYKGIDGPEIFLDNVDTKEWSDLLEDIQQSLNDSKPDKSVFATDNPKSTLFGTEGNEVAIDIEWLNNEGEGWQMVTYFTAPGENYYLSGKRDKEDIAMMLNEIDVKLDSTQIDAIYNHILEKYNNPPKISAKESYYGI